MNNRILLGWKIVGCINCRNFRRNRRSCYHFVIPIPYIITDQTGKNQSQQKGITDFSIFSRRGFLFNRSINFISFSKLVRFFRLFHLEITRDVFIGNFKLLFLLIRNLRRRRYAILGIFVWKKSRLRLKFFYRDLFILFFILQQFHFLQTWEFNAITYLHLFKH